MLRNVKEEILAQCKSHGCCKDVYREVCAADDRDALVDVYMRNHDWCMEAGVPTIETLRDEFKGLDDRHIYIDRIFDGETIDAQTAIFHHCSGIVNVAMDYDGAVIPMLYFCNGCEIHIECRQTNIPAIHVPLYIFGKNLVTTNGHGNATFRRYEK